MRTVCALLLAAAAGCTGPQESQSASGTPSDEVKASPTPPEPTPIHAASAEQSIAGPAQTLTGWVAEATSASSVRVLWGIDGEVYGVGASTLLHRDGFGTWLTAQSQAGDEWNAVWGPSNSEVHAVGAMTNGRGLEAISRDHGVTWDIRWQPTYGYSVWGSSADDYFVVGGITAHTLDGGKTWSISDLDGKRTQNVVVGVPPNVFVSSYAFTGAETSTQASIRISSDDGATWQLEPFGMPTGFSSFVHAPDGLYCLTNGEMVVTNRSGSWAVLGNDLPTKSAASQLWVTRLGTLVVPGPNGTLLLSRDAAMTWSSVTIDPAAGDYDAVWGDGQWVYVAGNSPFVYHIAEDLL